MKRRRSKSKAPARAPLITPQRVGALVLLALGLWTVSGFASRMLVAHRLNVEAQMLSRENQQLVRQNGDLGQQLQAVSQPDGAEEQARLHDYVRPDEKVYVMAAPSPSPATTPSPGSSATAPDASHRLTSGEAKHRSLWDALWAAITSPFRG